jgi:hypothetical protein
MRRARRTVFDRTGVPVAEDSITEARVRGLAVTVEHADVGVVRATPHLEVVLLRHDTVDERLLASELDAIPPPQLAVRLSFGGTEERHLAVHLPARGRARIVDLTAGVVPGPWDAVRVRSAFLCGAHVVAATDDTLCVHDLTGHRRFARPLAPADRVARIDDRHVAIGVPDAVSVLDIERDAVIARAVLDPYDGLFGGHGRLVVAHVDGALSLFAVHS